MTPDMPDELEVEKAAIRRAVRALVPGQALTLEQFNALGYGLTGKRRRPLTDDPMGYKPHPAPETPTT